MRAPATLGLAALCLLALSIMGCTSRGEVAAARQDVSTAGTGEEAAERSSVSADAPDVASAGEAEGSARPEPPSEQDEVVENDATSGPTGDSQLSGDGPPDLTSSVTTQGEGDVASTAEARVVEILTSLEATETDVGTVIAIPDDVLFDFDRADLKPGAAATIAQIAEVIAFHEGAPVRIEGHTDSVGPDAYNQELSERRALAVRVALVERHGIDGGRLTTTGFGESRPVAANTNADGSDNPAGRQANRRVEIVVEGVGLEP